MAVFRGFFQSRSQGSTGQLAERFLNLFEAHKVDHTQIPRLIPQIKYEDLESPRQLLAALTPKVIDDAAKLFGVQSHWLEGLDENIYGQFWGKRDLRQLLDYFSQAFSTTGRASWFPLCILTTSKKLDRSAKRPQLLMPVAVEAAGHIGDEPFHRALVCSTFFDWTNKFERIELKALAWLVHQQFACPIPLIVVSDEEMERLTENRAIPSAAWRSVLITSPSLEDFILAPGQSRVAAETDELPEVLAYLDAQGLRDFTFAPVLPILPEAAEVPPIVAPAASAVPKATATPGKREVQQAQWDAIIGAARTIWSQESQLTYVEVIFRLKRMPHLKASALSDSAIHKRIREAAPASVRGKPGRKPK